MTSATGSTTELPPSVTATRDAAVEAAKLRGEKGTWVIFREILPNALSPLVAEFGLRFIFAVLFISTLSFLGLGIQPPLTDWGRQQAARHVQPHRVQRLHHRQDVGLIAAGVGVGQHCGDGTAPQRLRGARPTLVVDVFHLGEDTSDVDEVHGGNSFSNYYTNSSAPMGASRAREP